MTDFSGEKTSVAENVHIDANTKSRKLQHQHKKKAPTTYFGYGSNLWKEQMSLRCPASTLIGIGRLPRHRWMINDRGYANVVTSSKAGSEVYGLVYTLTKDDEQGLDRNEGVPVAYTKEILIIDFWPLEDVRAPLDVTKEAEKREMLVYIDRNRIEDHQAKAEYVHRMNMGIKDGVLEGIPPDYVDSHLRPFIPVQERKGVEHLARRQALSFEDET